MLLREIKYDVKYDIVRLVINVEYIEWCLTPTTLAVFQLYPEFKIVYNIICVIIIKLVNSNPSEDIHFMYYITCENETSKLYKLTEEASI